MLAGNSTIAVAGEASVNTLAMTHISMLWQLICVDAAIECHARHAYHYQTHLWGNCNRVRSAQVSDSPFVTHKGIAPAPHSPFTTYKADQTFSNSPPATHKANGSLPISPVGTHKGSETVSDSLFATQQGKGPIPDSPVRGWHSLPTLASDSPPQTPPHCGPSQVQNPACPSHTC